MSNQVNKEKETPTMGMSASQARLIGLTARMNDIEYQGQQINQQRTTLSNQINELYNRLLDMEVPTPPSTSDYTKVQYSGKTGATNFTMSNVIPTGKDAAGNNTYTVDLAYKMSGHSVSRKSTTANISNAKEFLYYNLASEDLYRTSHSEYVYRSAGALNTLPEDPETDVLVRMTYAQYKDLNNYTSATNNIYKSNAKGSEQPESHLNEVNDPSSLEDTDVIYLRVNVADINENDALRALCYQDTSLVNTYEAPPTKTDEREVVYDGYKNDAQIKAQNLFVYDNGKAIEINSKQELEEYVNQGLKIIRLSDTDRGDFEVRNPNYNPEAGGTGYTVGNMPLYELNDEKAISKIGQATYNDCIEGLRNSFPEFDSLSDEELKAKFFVYIETTSSGTNLPHFIRKDDVGSITKDYTSAIVYDYDADGTYLKNQKTTDCQLEFDATTGRIGKIGIPNGDGTVTWVTLTAETVTDDVAYEKAFNDYEYKKYQYDQKQQEINLKTSIIQQEDKNLELKLTRLDNERNAVNTEIEAVKKVTEDNIQKSFKTFAG